MFKISAQTYNAFEEKARQDFRRRLVLALKRVFGAEAQRIPDAQLAELANVAVERAQEYELDLEYSVWAFYASMFVFGPDFDRNEQHEWSKDVLLDEKLAEDGVIGLLGLRIYMATGKTI